ncbi:MAG: diguanylate cyclase [Pseudomonadota bacterium]
MKADFQSGHRAMITHLGTAMALGVAMFGTALLGILTRPEGMLAVMWPANAIMLGVLVRYPRLASVWGWGFAFAGFMAADLLTGTSLYATLWLTTANVAGVAVGFVLFRYLLFEDRKLHRPHSMLYLFLISIAASGMSAMFGGVIAVLVFPTDPMVAFRLWFAEQFANYVVILPLVLTFPRPRDVMADMAALMRVGDKGQTIFRAALPLLTLVGSLVFGYVVGGPGAIVFPVPALLWCALSYRFATTALMVMLTCLWLMTGVEPEIVALLSSGDYTEVMFSLRMGIALLALAPLTVSSINSVRSALVHRLDHAASHDDLTGILSRGAFMQRGTMMMEQLARDRSSVAILLLDIDHFKRINDRFGHAAGDRVLCEFARIVRNNLRGQDLFARLGGEEFGLLLPHTDGANARAIAERIRLAVDQAVITHNTGEVSHLSVSAGLVHQDGGGDLSLDRMLLKADAALYRAKETGRNRVVDDGAAVQEETASFA